MSPISCFGVDKPRTVTASVLVYLGAYGEIIHTDSGYLWWIDLDLITLSCTYKLMLGGVFISRFVGNLTMQLCWYSKYL